MKKILILLFSLVFLTSTHIRAAETSPLDRLDKIADEALQMTKIGRFEAAKKFLEQFQDQFIEETSYGSILTMDELKIVMMSYNDAIRAINKVSLEPREKMDKVTTFRLVIDAINSHYQPMWTELQEPIMGAFSQIKEAAKEKDRMAYEAALTMFLEKYSLIQPSLKVDLSLEKLEKLDSDISFIDKFRNRIIEDDTQLVQLDIIESDLQYIFDKLSEDETDPSLWWVIITTGSIIVMTLSYVGWRKYRGEKHTKQKEHYD
ncbi:sporulation protein YpjB [Heyndrickxia oleronia]|uniref:sporulation protein YpjB n=1 Tax=Heyndrickxia oleronia TaxID=38875 RepID=UPI001B2B52CA|nr:sporulation protein YpjB [Heyndrickxia oleronia]GIN38170.1 hypothetical protein J19TS1_11190 [Heyndrickxia oleronia]